MVASSFKCELDALANDNFLFPSKIYLPRRLSEEDWLDHRESSDLRGLHGIARNDRIISMRNATTGATPAASRAIHSLLRVRPEAIGAMR